MIAAICLGSFAAYVALLIGLHFWFTRQQSRRLAAGAAFRARVRKHVHRGAFWS